MKKVSICRHCINSKRVDTSKSTNHAKDSYKTKKTNANPRNELSLKIKIDLIKFAEVNPKIGRRSLGKKFSCSKRQAKYLTRPPSNGQL